MILAERQTLMWWTGVKALYASFGDACLRWVTGGDLRRRTKQHDWQMAGTIVLCLIFAAYFGNLAISKVEDAIVLRDGQVVAARLRAVRHAKQVTMATVEYHTSSAQQVLECVSDVSLGYLQASPNIGDQINLSIRPGECSRPVARTSPQSAWFFISITLLSLAGSVACVVAGICCAEIVRLERDV